MSSPMKPGMPYGMSTAAPISAENILPTQGRDAPAFQEFPAAMMARIAYRQMSLPERGLLLTLRLECWVNREMPSDPAKLARVLGQPADEVIAALPGVMEFFEVRGSALFCPELEQYRAYLDARRARMVEGGRKSANRRKHPEQPDDTVSQSANTLQAPSKHLAGSLQAPSKVLKGGLQAFSTAQPSTAQHSKNQSLEHDDSWTSEYERSEIETSATEYARQSGGD